MRSKSKLLAIILSGLILALLVFIISIFVMSRLDVQIYYFQTYDDAQSQGFTNNNWPKQVSKTAKEVYAESQANIYDVWMKFKIEKEDSDGMVSHLRKLNDQEIRELQFRTPSYVDWWFEGFSQQAEKSSNAIDADVYIDENNCETSQTFKNAYIAIEKDSTTAYYWCGT